MIEQRKELINKQTNNNNNNNNIKSIIQYLTTERGKKQNERSNSLKRQKKTGAPKKMGRRRSMYLPVSVFSVFLWLTLGKKYIMWCFVDFVTNINGVSSILKEYI